MIETPQAVENAAEIATVPGIDSLLIGTSDLSLELGITGQIGHEKVQNAYATVAEACRKSGKILGMGGVYDEQWAKHYISVGARFVLAGSDHGLLLDAATKRASFLNGLAPESSRA
jgi:2-keto-3-deoxy-L-rhamnonate aldolase RhmA